MKVVRLRLRGFGLVSPPFFLHRRKLPTSRPNFTLLPTPGCTSTNTYIQIFERLPSIELRLNLVLWSRYVQRRYDCGTPLTL
jgi:hypothetical protein